MSRSAESREQNDRPDLRQLFATSFSEPASDENELRHAVLEYVRAAKAERRKPELVIVSLKRAVFDAAAAKISYRAANELTDRVVRWFIDGYYGADTPQGERGMDLRFTPSPRVT